MCVLNVCLRFCVPRVPYIFGYEKPLYIFGYGYTSVPGSTRLSGPVCLGTHVHDSVCTYTCVGPVHLLVVGSLRIYTSMEISRSQFPVHTSTDNPTRPDTSVWESVHRRVSLPVSGTRFCVCWYLDVRVFMSVSVDFRSFHHRTSVCGHLQTRLHSGDGCPSWTPGTSSALLPFQGVDPRETRDEPRYGLRRNRRNPSLSSKSAETLSSLITSKDVGDWGLGLGPPYTEVRKDSRVPRLRPT